MSNNPAGAGGAIGRILAEPQSLVDERPPLTADPRRQMTRWLDPMNRRRNDRLRSRAKANDDREIHAVRADAPITRYAPDGSGGFGFDYAADIGDAFDPTMQVAWTIGRQQLLLEANDGSGSRLPLPRGSLLVLGGDEVYPFASAENYRRQAVLPYMLAAEGETGAEVLAIPGNHDWWGGLDHWRAVFCRNEAFGGWGTRQATSWWAVGLPHGWWMWGLDTFVDGTINETQRAYFRDAAAALAPGNQVILCTPVPLWHMQATKPADVVVVDRFVSDVIGPTGAHVALYLSGDSHLFAAYRRQRVDGTEELHLSAGGGGAFLQPTHHLAAEVPRAGSGDGAEGFTGGQFWPLAAASRGHDIGSYWRTLLDWQSLMLASELGTLHALYGAAAGFGVRRLGSTSPRGIGQVLCALLTSWPGAISSIVGLLLFLRIGTSFARPDSADPEVKRIARRAGVAHGLAQFVVVVGIATITHRLLWLRSGGWPSLAGLRAAALGGVVGGLAAVALMIRYLLSVNMHFPVNGNEAFAAQRLLDSKHFLRCRIAADGALTIWLIAFARPDTGWERAYRSGAAVPPSAAGASSGEPVVVAEVPWTATIPASPALPV